MKSDHANKLKSLKKQLSNVQRNLNVWARNNNTVNINNLMNMNDEDDLRNEKSSLKRKIKHLAASQLIGRQILEKTIDEIYQTLLKLPGYKSRYTRIASNNETFGAISLAKINIQSIANTLIGYNTSPTKEKSKSPPSPCKY